MTHRQWRGPAIRAMLVAMDAYALTLPRTYLFVPADRPDRLPKALASGADVVIADLEDAVAPGAKARARQALAAWLDAWSGGPDAGSQPSSAEEPPGRPGHAAHASRPTLLVRLNAPGSRGFEDDLVVADRPGVAGVVVPKAECSRDLARVAAALPGRALLPLVETAAGLAAARALARARNVHRLVFGSIDFQADLGIEADEDTLRPYRAEVVLASRLAGLPPPVDGVTPAFDDEALVLRDTLGARRQGFGAKLCIHPRQLAAVRRGFAPTAAELRWAREVLQAAQGAQGAAVALDGRMVDAPVVLRAQALLAAAG